MGSTGCRCDNARAERFFATLKKELIYKRPLSRMARAEVREKTFAWVEGDCNKKRRNTANERKLLPLKKRKTYYENQLAAEVALDKCKGRNDLAQSGVYFLFGATEDTDDSVVYVGKAGGAQKRRRFAISLAGAQTHR